MNIENNKILLFFFLIFAIANIISTQLPYVGFILTIVEYSLVFYCLYRGNTLNATILFLAFTSLSLEIDAFIYNDITPPFNRYQFLNPPFIGELLYDSVAVGLFFVSWKQNKELDYYSNDVIILWKWLFTLGCTGLISALICIVVNDNNINTTNWYPKLSISLFLKYFAFSCTCLAIHYNIIDSYNKEKMVKQLIIVLQSIAISGIFSALIGLHGFYGEIDTIMLVSLAVTFCPCLILFSDERFPLGKFNIVIAFFLIVLSYSNQIAIGSKWYIVIAVSLIFCIYQKAKIKSTFVLIGLFFLFIFFIPLISDLLMSLMQSNDFNQWKFSQSMGMMNFVSYESFYEWFINLDDSAKFRIDEPINIMLEYIEKPYYALFGKGFGGTVIHNTYFCDWDAESSFTEEQRLYQLFYSMHETFGVLFLRHGFSGIIFFCTFFVILFKKRDYSPWTVVAIIWFLFYWSYGISLRIGAAAFIISLHTENNEIE